MLIETLLNLITVLSNTKCWSVLSVSSFSSILISKSFLFLLIIPKKRINTINDLEDEDKELIGSMVLVAKNLAKKYKIDESGYRLVWNTNKDGGQTVYHIHLHLLGGEKLREF